MEKRRERRTNRFSTFCSSLFITSVYINLFALHHPCLVSLLVPRNTTTFCGGGGGYGYFLELLIKVANHSELLNLKHTDLSLTLSELWKGSDI